MEEICEVELKKKYGTIRRKIRDLCIGGIFPLVAALEKIKMAMMMMVGIVGGYNYLYSLLCNFFEGKEKRETNNVMIVST